MTAYYNENDPYAAQWLRNLISAGHIAPGDVDERSISDVKAAELIGYTQCHFFAGIGVWSYALRLAGWPDDRPVWTGSCPCQPFSAAGKGEGAADARHLWPEWFRLIREHRPVAIFGEQVSAAIRHSWLDLVSADLEGLDYTLGAAVVGAHSVGAPHIRQRLYFVAESDSGGSSARQGNPGEVCGFQEAQRESEYGAFVSRGSGTTSELADSPSDGRQQRRAESGGRGAAGGCGEGGVVNPESEQVGISGRTRKSRSAVGDTERERLQEQRRNGRIPQSQVEPSEGQGAERAGASVNGFWSDAHWLPCIDGKARAVEPGTFPLAHGAAARVGRLRAYGNCIVAPQAAEFIRVYLLGEIL